MVDEYPSTNESDIDAFLEYARDKVAENDLSYDTASFLDFESLLQNCAANHFLDTPDDVDSMASEASFSGYVNEESGAKYKSTVLMKRDIISDNAYHRMKGIIARKKKIASEKSQPSDASMKENNNDTNSIEYHFEKSRKDPKLWTNRNNARNDSIQSDSSDSILDDVVPRQTRPRKHRRRPNTKKKSRGGAVKPDHISQKPNENVSTLTSDSAGKDKALHSDVTDRSSSAASSEGLIDTNNGILPSLVKKGIKYYDVPKIERALERMSRKAHTLDRKQKVFDQLLATRPVQVDESQNNKQKGMALVHKLRAERKMALQAAFLRYSGKEGAEEPSRFVIPDIVKDENSNLCVSFPGDNEVLVPTITQHQLSDSPSSLSSFSSPDAKKRFRIFMGKTRRSLSHSYDKEGLLQKHVHDDFWMNSSYSSPDEGVVFQKSSPFGKIKFPRINESVHYEELSTSTLTNDDTWNDSSEYSIIMRSSDSNKNHDENQLHTSSHSVWSEMSFHSDLKPFAACFKTQPNSYQTIRPPPIQINESKTIHNDSFDEIVSRNTPIGSSFSNHFAEESPTGVMDFLFESEQEPQKKDIGDTLAFVDEGEENHVFTDKDDDSFVMKSPGKLLCASPTQLCEPVFLSPTRFVI